MKNTTAKTARPPRAFGSGFALGSLPSFAWAPPWAPLRALAGLLAFLLLAALLSGSGGRAHADDKSDELREKYEQLEQQLADEKKELQDIQARRQNAQAERESLQRQQQLMKEQIETLVATMDETGRLIEIKQLEIDEKQAEIDARWDEFKDQMVAMQIMHDTGAVAMLASAESLYELLTFSDVLQQMSDKQMEMLDFMKTQRAGLNAQKAALDEDLARLEADKAEMEAKVSELAASIQAANSAISAAQALEQAQQVEIDATQAAAAQARKEFDDYLRSVTASSFTPTFLSGSFVWPTNSSKITVYYGSGGHGGIDIAAPAGTPIYAAAEGTVRISGWHDHTHSYGNYVVIDHGGGMATFYAHMSSRACSAGDYVQQGDLIGYVGNTGYSFGNHLHFEVRINGDRTDPMGYFNS